MNWATFAFPIEGVGAVIISCQSWKFFNPFSVTFYFLTWIVSHILKTSFFVIL